MVCIREWERVYTICFNASSLSFVLSATYHDWNSLVAVVKCPCLMLKPDTPLFPWHQCYIIGQALGHGLGRLVFWMCVFECECYTTTLGSCGLFVLIWVHWCACVFRLKYSGEASGPSWGSGDFVLRAKASSHDLQLIYHTAFVIVCVKVNVIFFMSENAWKQ